MSRHSQPPCRMTERLPIRFNGLKDEVHEPTQVLERSIVHEAFAVRLVHQIRIRVTPDINEADDLVVAEMLDGVVHATLIKSQPVVMRLPVWPNAKAVAIDADPGPFAQPSPNLHPWCYLSQSLAL